MLTKRWCVLGLALLGAAAPCLARAGDWPTKIDFADGTELGVKGIFQYDWVAFTGDRLPDGSHLFGDGQAWRRQVLEAYLKRPGGFEVMTGYAFVSGTWLDNFVAFDTRAGKLRIGEFRTLVGWEKATTSSAATTFVEASLPVLLAYEGRRAGIGWTYTGIDHFTLQAQWFAPHDLNHKGDGRTVAARVVYAPVKRKSDVIHLGVSASRETRDGHHARFRVRPETHLTPIRLVDTQMLDGVGHIDRAGLEAAWMRGPLLLQSEYLGLHATRAPDRDFRSHGGYLAVSWMLTGESRPYKKTAFGDPKPTHGWGAIGVGVRYSRVDLDDRPVMGGVEHDWTLGVNWYINQHFKLQANEVYAVVEHGRLPVSPHIYELRAQMTF